MNDQYRQDGRDSPDEFDSWVARQLRDRQPYLEDRGFSDQVMAAVPIRSRSDHARTFLSLILLALALTFLSFGVFQGLDRLNELLVAFMALPFLTFIQVGLAMSLGIAALGGIAIWQGLKSP